MQPCCGHERFIIVMTDTNHTCASALFEVWLQTDLQRLYDRTLIEPVPEELLLLVLPVQEIDPDQT